ncbi:ATP-grasp domain-containing protein [Dickeya chrysanthemi]|uniref:ATP-grasp domain-containing protein n=1 Tax=Dickeya chrysanthemi TaxID=556 RepID=UPI001C8E1A67|nr:ATP-grasp domain-containing protein [Dickeya chrysanthemi]MBX9447224.1 ATP-grasp domain-containing protein [Dickeya chrysanthemi]
MAHILFIDSNLTGPIVMHHAKSLGHYVSFIESGEFSWYKKNEKNKKILNSLDNYIKTKEITDYDELYENIIAIEKIKKIDAIICLPETAIEFAAKAAQDLSLPFPTVESVNRCRNKLYTRNTLNEKKIKNAKYYTAKNKKEAIDSANKIGYPVILKPISGRDSFFSYKVKNQTELESYWHEAERKICELPVSVRVQYERGFLIEEYLSGEMVSVEVAHNGKETKILMVSSRGRSEKNEMVEYRIDMPADISEEEWLRCEEYAISVIQALELHYGIFHLEMMITSRGPILVEANARIMGGFMPLLYLNFTEHDIYKLMFDIHLGRKPDIDIKKMTEKYATTIRLEALSESTINHEKMLKCISNFSKNIIFSETIESSGSSISIKPQDVLGRIQLLCNSAQQRDSMTKSLINSIESECNVELLH